MFPLRPQLVPAALGLLFVVVGCSSGSGSGTGPGGSGNPSVWSAMSTGLEGGNVLSMAVDPAGATIYLATGRSRISEIVWQLSSCR